MKYTDFLIEQFNEHHNAPKLNQEQTYRMLQIIDFESKLATAERNKDSQSSYKFRKKIKELTKNQRPHFLLEEMAKLSK